MYYLLIKLENCPASMFTSTSGNALFICDPDDATRYRSLNAAKNDFYDYWRNSKGLGKIEAAYIYDDQMNMVSPLTV